MRICSLLPGATEVVAALGLADQLVGVSHECDYPPAVRRAPVMVRSAVDSECASSAEIDREVRIALTSGQALYTLDEAGLSRAQPDVIIAQDLCHVCAVTPGQLQQALQRLPKRPDIVSLNPTRLDHVLDDIDRIGAAVGKAQGARALTASLRARLESIRDRTIRASRRPRLVCLEWLDPLFAAGHWVPDMVACAGGQDALGQAGGPSQRITWEQLVAAEPDVLVLMPCGFSIDRTERELTRLTSHADWTRLPAVRENRVFAVEAGSYFSRPGPRLTEGVAILAAVCQPSLYDDRIPAGARRIPACRP